MKKPCDIKGNTLCTKTFGSWTGYSYEFDGIKYSTGIYFFKFSILSGFNAKRKMLLLNNTVLLF